MTTELEATSNEDMSAEQPTETTEAPKNELADFRAARESERSGEESVDVEAAAPEPDTPDVPQENQIMDPDTGAGLPSGLSPYSGNGMSCDSNWSTSRRNLQQRCPSKRHPKRHLPRKMRRLQ